MIENAHIFLWLAKDTCWVNEWRAGALTMIAPTLGVAVYLLVRSWHSQSERFHNLAVCIWICGNCIWMIGEFFKYETRPYTSIAFFAGLAVLLWYYCFVFPKARKALFSGAEQ